MDHQFIFSFLKRILNWQDRGTLPGWAHSLVPCWCTGPVSSYPLRVLLILWPQLGLQLTVSFAWWFGLGMQVSLGMPIFSHRFWGGFFQRVSPPGFLSFRSSEWKSLGSCFFRFLDGLFRTHFSFQLFWTDWNCFLMSVFLHDFDRDSGLALRNLFSSFLKSALCLLRRTCRLRAPSCWETWEGLQSVFWWLWEITLSFFWLRWMVTLRSWGSRGEFDWHEWSWGGIWKKTWKSGWFPFRTTCFWGHCWYCACRETWWAHLCSPFSKCS